MMKAKEVHFDLGTVENALSFERDLYVRGYDAVARVSMNGDLNTLYTFEAQSPIAFKGLCLLKGNLYTFDRPLNGRPILIEIMPKGETKIYKEAKLKNPIDLIVMDNKILILDQQLPMTRVLELKDEAFDLLAEFRNLTHWRVVGEKLYFSDNSGIHQIADGVTKIIIEEQNIVAFDDELNFVCQEAKEGQPVFRVKVDNKIKQVEDAEKPVYFYSVSSKLFLRFRNKITLAAVPDGLQALPESDDLGAVVKFGDGIAYVDDNRDLKWSHDSKGWQTIELSVKASDLIVADASNVVASGRRSSVWLQALQI